MTSKGFLQTAFEKCANIGLACQEAAFRDDMTVYFLKSEASHSVRAIAERCASVPFILSAKAIEIFAQKTNQPIDIETWCADNHKSLDVLREEGFKKSQEIMNKRHRKNYDRMWSR